MKIKYLYLACLLAFGISSGLQAQTYDQLWKQVEVAKNLGKPQTAIQLTTDIFRKAEKEKNSPQMLKAYTERSNYRNSLTPDSFYVYLKDMEQWATTADKPLDRAVLHSLIAGIYADYAIQNSWQLRRGREIVNEEPSADIREWSGNMFVQQVLKNSCESLKNTDLLLNASTQAYIPFVTQGATSSYYKHDMYHLLGSRAVEALSKLQYIDNDTLSKSEINGLYQQMISVYRKAANDEALVLVTLDYLGWQQTTVESVSPRRPATKGKIGLAQNRYIAGYNKLIEQYKAKDICAEVYLAKAQYALNSQERTSALQLCEEAIRLYPSYKRINAVKQCKQEILAPSLNVTAGHVAYPGADVALDVNHRNLGGFTVVLYRVNTTDFPAQNTVIDDAYYKNRTSKLSEKHFSLLRSADYQIQDTTFTIQAPNEGCYVMRIVPDTKAETNTGQFLYITRFTALSRTLPQQQCEVVALDAQTGRPVPRATIVLHSYEGKVLNTLTANEEGKATFEWKADYRNLSVRKGSDRWMPHQYVGGGYFHYEKGDQKSEAVQLLTDRALYRPGQTVYVKGIAYTQQLDTARVTVGKSYTVTLLDVNRQEVARQSVHTNEFGSFSTTFALPAVCLNGNFTLHTEGGEVNFQVAEYKRPTFDITFDKLEGSYRLGDKVRVKGHAKTFSGVPLQDLEVQYAVTRIYGYGWGILPGSTETLDSGTTTLDAEGSFSIPMSLEGMHEQQNRLLNYRFSVEATITNKAGETQSSSYALAVGERSLFLNVNLGSERICKDDAIKATFEAANPDGQPVGVEGTYHLYPVVDAKKETYSEKAVYTAGFVSNKETALPDWKSLPSGAYKLVLTAKDAQGREVKGETTLVLFSLADKRPATATPLWYVGKNETFDAAHPAEFYFGTSFKNTYVLLTVLSGEKVLENKSLEVSDSIFHFTYPYKEEYGNGLTVNLCFVKENQLYQQDVSLRKRLPEKNLTLKWEVFRDKLRPGQKEEWKLTVKGSQGTANAAEMLALMYDASLDKLAPYTQTLQLYYGLNLPFTNWEKPYPRHNGFYCSFPSLALKVPGEEYDRFPANEFYRGVTRALMGRAGGVSVKSRALKEDEVLKEEVFPMAYAGMVADQALSTDLQSKASNQVELPEATPDIRTNFSETAFFYPHLRTNEQGEISFSFTMPESLTRWSFRGFAHTKGMLTGMINGEATTSKEFMLTPNLPRFVRVGDKTSVAATVANLTGNALSGTVDFILFDPITEAIISTQKQKFTSEAGQTTAVSFQFTATDKYDVLGCRMVADGGTFSDGEQHLLPVLSNKEVLTETIVLPIRGQATKTFSLEKLFNNHSKTASNQQLTVEFTANPVWYAVQALPALSQPLGDNAVSWATAYYANTLAAYIMNNQPRMQAIFDTWKLQGGSKETFLSNLSKNQEVKNILLSESPWVMEAKNEQQQKERIATLFDLNTISGNKLSAQTKLKELQLPDGSWPWYKGMNGSEPITTYIAGLCARLAELTGQPMDQGMLEMQTSASDYLEKQARKEYDALRKLEKEGGKITGISGSLVDYLYVKAISNSQPVNNDMQQYFLTKATQMLGTASMKAKAKLAVVFDKAGRKQDAQRFMVSLKEHLTKSEEMGMYFAFNENPYSWNGQAIPAHVAVMEAFDQVANDTMTVEEMKFWLLKQKQTQQWNSSVSTADAVYALLERASDPTAVQAGARLTFGGKVLDTKTSQMAGVGYVKETFTDNRSIDAKEITVAKQGKGIAWGAVYARFEEKTDQVKQQGGEMNIEKKLYVERLVNNVRQLEPVTAQTILAVGDKVVSRITIRTDRAMEFIQLKDQRGACFEPIENLSGYRWSNGFGYYVDVKDASTNFFFDGLGKGVFVLEYAYRVARTGTYDAGLATIQCAYAPEYASHSAAITVISE